MSGTQLLTLEEVAQRLRCTVEHVFQLIEEGELAVFNGGNVLVPAAELEAYVSRNTVRARAAERAADDRRISASLARLRENGSLQRLLALSSGSLERVVLEPTDKQRKANRGRSRSPKRHRR
ncbi:helix-turn-helix domain-containing protein [Phenylobacterium sp.]|uniref:helix-turn-helix domain-containing protein n=1 Tax=Phenylobacterium sp. TaxID=1871053 RepID=UPI0028111565|nr:helix-turn-helix domain-containing protein [Phenylobacterium sp.]